MSTQDGLAAALTEAAATTLETMCFAGIVGEDVEFGGEMLAAEVLFSGHAQGCVSIRLTPEAARSLSSGFLGKDDTDLTTAAIDTVVLELANMICGRMLSMHEPEGDFALSAPVLTATPRVCPQAACTFALDVGAIACSAMYTEANQAPQ